MYNQQNYYAQALNSMEFCPPRHDITMFDDSEFSSYERHHVPPFGFPTNVQMPPYTDNQHHNYGFPHHFPPYATAYRPSRRLFPDEPSPPIASPFTNSPHIDTMIPLSPFPQIAPQFHHNIGAPTIDSPSQSHRMASASQGFSPTASPKEKKLQIMSHKKYESMIEAMFQIRKELPDLIEPEGKPVDSSFDVRSFVLSISNISLDDRSTPLKAEFVDKIIKIAEGYKAEVDRINEVCEDCCKRMQTLLHEQSMIRPVTKHEFQYKKTVIRAKFDKLIYTLKSRVCKAIVDHHKNYENAAKGSGSHVMRSRSASSVSSDDDDFLDDDDDYHGGKHEM